MYGWFGADIDTGTVIICVGGSSAIVSPIVSVVHLNHAEVAVEPYWCMVQEIAIAAVAAVVVAVAIVVVVVVVVVSIVGASAVVAVVVSIDVASVAVAVIVSIVVASAAGAAGAAAGGGGCCCCCCASSLFCDLLAETEGAGKVFGSRKWPCLKTIRLPVPRARRPFHVLLLHTNLDLDQWTPGSNCTINWRTRSISK